MKPDGYSLFSDCHRRYVLGTRIAFRERLEKAHGSDWWNKGVVPAISDAQQQNLARMIARDSSGNLEDILDTQHFGSIITQNHTEAFGDAFNNSYRTFNQLRTLTRIRNDWAHVQNMPIARVMRAIEIMEDILASLRRREALDIKRIRENFSEHPTDAADDQSQEEEVMQQDMQELDSDYPSEARPTSLMELWHQLQAYLVLNIVVEPIPDDTRERVRVILRVSNEAPAGDGLPEVYFSSVEITTVDSSRDDSIRISDRNTPTRIGSLGPGQTSERKLTIWIKQLASTEFKLHGTIDPNTLFSFRKLVAPPSEVVEPILNELMERFEELGIRGFLDGVLASITKVEPASMTMSEAASLRRNLEEFKSVIQGKLRDLDKLFRDFGIHKGSTLGTRFGEIMQFLRDLHKKLGALDEAISQTDTDMISQAANELEQLQLAIIRLENTIKGMISPEQ